MQSQRDDERAFVVIVYIPIQPKGAPRPRVTRFGAYNVKDYTDYKNVIAIAAKTKIKTPLNTAVSINIEFFFEAPKSWSKKKREDTKWNTGKPDIDNLIKGVLDGLNGVAYTDDRQVVQIAARKQYTGVNGIQIIIEEVF